MRSLFVIVGLWFLIGFPFPNAIGARPNRNAAKAKPIPKIENFLGGVKGVVKTSKGQPIDGLMVQLISDKTSIRTTVYTNELGQFEFPKLETGYYTLRLARPL